MLFSLGYKMSSIVFVFTVAQISTTGNLLLNHETVTKQETIIK